jgi:hypothetical protein
MNLMQRGLTEIETNALKICIKDRRKKDEQQVNFRDKKGKISTKLTSYGKLIEYTYPLLNPGIVDDKVRRELHQTWFKDLPS